MVGLRRDASKRSGADDDDGPPVPVHISPKALGGGDSKTNPDAAMYLLSQYFNPETYAHVVAVLTIVLVGMAMYVFIVAEMVREERWEGYEKISDFVRSAAATETFYDGVAAFCDESTGYADHGTLGVPAVNPMLPAIVAGEFADIDTMRHSKFFRDFEATVYLSGAVIAPLLGLFVGLHWYFGHASSNYHRGRLLTATHHGVQMASHTLLAILTVMLVLNLMTDASKHNVLGRCRELKTHLQGVVGFTYHSSMDHTLHDSKRDNDVSNFVLAVFLTHAFLHYHVLAMARTAVDSGMAALVGIGKQLHVLPSNAAKHYSEKQADLVQSKQDKMTGPATSGRAHAPRMYA